MNPQTLIAEYRVLAGIEGESVVKDGRIGQIQHCNFIQCIDKSSTNTRNKATSEGQFRRELHTNS
jgi:hypothetical protein